MALREPIATMSTNFEPFAPVCSISSSMSILVVFQHFNGLSFTGYPITLIYFVSMVFLWKCHAKSVIFASLWPLSGFCIAFFRFLLFSLYSPCNTISNSFDFFFTLKQLQLPDVFNCHVCQHRVNQIYHSNDLIICICFLAISL